MHSFILDELFASYWTHISAEKMLSLSPVDRLSFECDRIDLGDDRTPNKY
ncbi:MAG: hypothetical protein HC789_04415 [Microcoleus sp. CSU_2_2]|nr:hypothetical protein [Microcoleus sp. CSU_2_2]